MTHQIIGRTLDALECRCGIAKKPSYGERGEIMGSKNLTSTIVVRNRGIYRKYLLQRRL